MVLAGAGRHCRSGARDILSRVTDPEAAQAAVEREFNEQFDLKQNSQSGVAQARAGCNGRRRVLEVGQARLRGAVRTSLMNTIADVDDSIAHMYSLALHIDAFESNNLVERDHVPPAWKKRASAWPQADPGRAPLKSKRASLNCSLQLLEATASRRQAAESSWTALIAGHNLRANALLDRRKSIAPARSACARKSRTR